MTTPAVSSAVRTADLNPIRYRWFDRFSDRRNGVKDGRKGVPDVDSGVFTTPTFEALAHEFDQLAEQERRNMLTDIDALLRAEHEWVARREVATDVVLGLEKDVESASTPLGPDDLRRRVGGESGTSAEIVAARRLREQAAAAGRIKAQLAIAREDLRGCEVQLARFRGAIRVRAAVGAATVRRSHAHFGRRLACYQRSLVRRHPDGVQLNRLFEARRPKLPEWVDRAGDYPMLLEGQQ